MILHGKGSKDTPVSEIMSDKVAYVTPDRDRRRMHGTDDRKALPPPAGTRRGRQVLGIVSIGDLVKETICSQQFIISELERYIAG